MKKNMHLLLPLLAVLLLSACAGTNGTRIADREQTAGEMAADAATASRASVVHVNDSSRLATLRNGNMFATGEFLVVNNRDGQQTGILKVLPKRPLGLRTADILEGEPDINNIVTRASAAEAARLAQIYRDPEE